MCCQLNKILWYLRVTAKSKYRLCSKSAYLLKGRFDVCFRLVMNGDIISTIRYTGLYIWKRVSAGEMHSDWQCRIAAKYLQHQITKYKAFIKLTVHNIIVKTFYTRLIDFLHTVCDMSQIDTGQRGIETVFCGG